MPRKFLLGTCLTNLLLLTDLCATSFSWNVGSGTWGFNVSWTPPGPPGVADTVTFPDRPSTPITVSNIDGKTVISSTSTNSNTTSYVFTGTGLTLTSTGTALTLRGLNNFSACPISLSGASGGSISLVAGVSGLNTGARLGNLNLGGLTRSISTVSLGADTDLYFMGVVSNGGLTFSGSGVSAFEGSSVNTFTGDLTVNGGSVVLRRSADTACVNGNVIVNGGDLIASFGGGENNQFGLTPTTQLFLHGGVYNQLGSSQILNAITMDGGTFTNTGTLTLNTTGTAITMGAVTITGTIALSGASGADIVMNSALSGKIDSLTLKTVGNPTRIINVTDSSGILEIPILTSGNYQKTGPGTLLLTGSTDNTVTSSIASAGTIQASKSAVAFDNLLINGGTVNCTLSNQFNSMTPPLLGFTPSGGVLNINGTTQKLDSITMADAGSITGTGILELHGSTTVLQMGTVSITTSIALKGPSTMLPSIQMISTGGGTATLGNIDLGTVNRRIEAKEMNNNLTIAGAISGGVDLQFTVVDAANTISLTGSSSNTYNDTDLGSGILALNKSSSAIALPKNVTITGGTLKPLANNQFATISQVTLSAGSWDLNSTNQEINKLTYTGGSTTGSGIVTMNDAAASFTMSSGLTFTGTVYPSMGGTVLMDGAGTGTVAAIQTGSMTPMIDVNTVGAVLNVNYLTGLGSFDKVGTGQLELGTGTSNDFSGSATLTAGILALNKTGGAVAIPGSLVVNGGTVKTTVANQFGAASTLFLSGGAFDLNMTGQQLSALNFDSGSVQNNTVGLTLTSGGTPLTMTGGTSITGQVSLTGGANAVVSYITTHAGNATVVGLDLGSSHRIFSIAAGGGQMNVTGALTGSGGFEKQGGGTLEFSGIDPTQYNGSVTVTNGTLLLNRTSGIFGGAFSVTSGSTLKTSGPTQFQQSVATLQLNGGIFDLDGTAQSLKSMTVTSGTIQNNTGLIALFGTGDALQITNSSIPGSVELIQGNVKIGTAGDASTVETLHFKGTGQTIDVVPSNATLTVQSLVAMNDFSKTGAGTLVLTGASTYGANSTVGSGTIQIDGTLGGGVNDLVIQPGATIKGAGTLTGNLQLQGTLAPGSSIGQIAIIGSPVFQAGSVTQIEINPSLNDFIDITGDLTIEPGATAQIIPLPVTYPSTYTSLILKTSGSITGEYTAVTSNYPLFVPTLEYTNGLPNQIALLNVELLNFSALATSGNPGHVARYLDTLNPPPDSDLANVLANLRLVQSAEELNEALNEMQPSHLKGLALAQEDNGIRERQAITHRLMAYPEPCCYRWMVGDTTVWVDVQGDIFRQKPQQGELGFKSRTGMLTFGVDQEFWENITFGVAGAYSQTRVKWNPANSGRVESGYGSVYASYAPKNYYITAIVSGAANAYHERRDIAFTGIDRRAKGSYKGWEGVAHLDFGGRFLGCQREIRPFISLDYIYLHQKGFKESGADSLDLVVNSSSYNLLRTEAGGFFNVCLRNVGSAPLSFQAKISYINETRFGGRDYQAHLVDTAGSFTVRGLAPQRNLGSAGAGFTYTKKIVSVSAWYEGELGKNYWNNSGQILFRAKF